MLEFEAQKLPIVCLPEIAGASRDITMINSAYRLHTFAALLLASSMSWAAPAAPRPALDELVQALELTPEQQGPVRSLFEQARADREARRQSTRAERMARRESLDRELATLLSPAQFERLQAWRQAHPRPDRPQRPQKPGAAQ